MKITLNKAFDLLSGCAAIIFTNEGRDHLIKPSLSELDGGEENEFMYLSWTDQIDNFYMKFTEGCNSTVTILGSSMKLVDSDGDWIDLKLVFPTQLESFCQDSDIIFK